MNARSHEQRPTDEALLAFVDGELSADEAAAIVRYLESDADARALVEAFRQSGVNAAAAYCDVLGAPVPQRLVNAALGQLPTASPAHTASNVVPLRRSASVWPRVSIILAPLAAAVLLAIGTVAGYRLMSDETAPTGGFQLAVGPVAPGTPTHSLLEKTPANQPVATGTSELMVVATFFDRHDRPCREFEVTTTTAAAAAANTSMSAAIGCRNADGRWSIEGAAHLAGGPTPPIVEFSPASGQSYSAFEGLLRSIGAKPALPVDQEQALLAKRWTK